MTRPMKTKRSPYELTIPPGELVGQGLRHEHLLTW